MRALLAFFVFVLSSCAHVEPLTPQQADAVVASPERPEADRALDPGRKPSAFLSFLGVGEGAKVAELMAGGGYTVELLSLAVGPTGVVYAENPKTVLERFAEKPFAERLARLHNVQRLDRELDDPFPSSLEGTLDVVVSNAIYHDTVWLKTDREKMNRAVYWALKRGGAYVVCDSSSKRGRGTQDAEALHRLDETVVRDELTKAGFSLVAEGNFLRNPQDARDWNASPREAGDKRGTSDRFCLRFERR